VGRFLEQLWFLRTKQKSDNPAKLKGARAAKEMLCKQKPGVPPARGG
jgi:hypothetical protein